MQFCERLYGCGAGGGDQACAHGQRQHDRSGREKAERVVNADAVKQAGMLVGDQVQLALEQLTENKSDGKTSIVDFEEGLLAVQTVLTHPGIRQRGIIAMPTATYKELLIEAIPQVIETEAEYDRIVRRFGDLVGKGRARSPEETRLLRLLALLVEDYDRRHALPPDNSTPAERLQFLLEHSGKTAADLRPVFGQRSHVHEALTGERSISAPQALKLGQLFWGESRGVRLAREGCGAIFRPRHGYADDAWVVLFAPGMAVSGCEQ
jgi:HTH-type transcriptional regulator/antitoxin HigA